ncbi:MAG TPA: winged helix-turn-helix domain-containing protein [Planctomycetaceae bacterium]|nr:winged helix-turn-helix domain-containing protein [Planctomycetaceae bacterium]HQZ63751.1 winged helix-turn-helix domain-containing protein [Planctomycetaceae bacterium]
MKKKTRAMSSTEAVAVSSTKSPARGFPVVSKVATSAADDSAKPTASTAARWTFLTNHSHVLILISRNPDVVLRQVAIRVGITERAVQRIIADLEEAGILEREKVGRQNHYRIIADKPLRHSVESHRTIADLLSLMDVSVE